MVACIGIRSPNPGPKNPNPWLLSPNGPFLAKRPTFRQTVLFSPNGPPFAKRSSSRPTPLAACLKFADLQHFCPENVGGLLKICRPPALLPRKRSRPVKKSQTGSTAAGIYDLRLLQIGRCGGLSPNGPPRARLLHGQSRPQRKLPVLEDTFQRNRGNLFLKNPILSSPDISLPMLNNK